MKTVTITPYECKNYTPRVREAIEELGACGGVIKFEEGEYHFYREGALKVFLPVSNNDLCDKHVVFPIFDKKSIKIDGGGANFVFHEVTFPFAVTNSSNITFSNFTVDTAVTPVGVFTIGKVSDEGFYFGIDKEKTPYFIEDGALIFKREYGERSGKERMFGLHGISQWGVQYLFTGECKSSKENLPAKYVCVDAEEREDGLFLKYREENEYPIRYDEGAGVSSILDGGRDVDVMFFADSDTVKIENITVRRGIGMGVIAQFTKDIEIDGFRTDESFHSGGSTLTADSMHFVNCSGTLEIKNCEITHTMDDAINVHGAYTRVMAVNGDTVTVKIGHQQQYFVNPYKAGDTIFSLSDKSFDYTARLTVLDSHLSRDGASIDIKVGLLDGKVTVGELIESPYRMPAVHIHDNRFYHYPHLRISGAGDIVIENNTFEYAIAALLGKDLAKYWYESGRIKSLIFRNNVLKDCNALAGISFITVDVDGVAHENTPKIHERVEIYSNRFEGIKDRAITVAGVKELIIRDNDFASEADRVIYVDGKKI